MQTTTEYSRHTMARMLICLMIALQACQALAADATYVCPMRGRPCPTTVYPAAGKCGTCGMALITQAEYDAQKAKLGLKSVVMGGIIPRRRISASTAARSGAAGRYW